MSDEVELDVIVGDGKYRVVFFKDGRLVAYRHESTEVWRNLTGDGLVLALCQKIRRLEEEKLNLEAVIQFANQGYTNRRNSND